jgi:hypothetical protein
MRQVRILATGSLALYVNLLIAGQFNASFGGRATAPFALMIALAAMGARLRYGLTGNPAPQPQP